MGVVRTDSEAAIAGVEGQGLRDGPAAGEIYDAVIAADADAGMDGSYWMADEAGCWIVEEAY